MVIESGAGQPPVPEQPSAGGGAGAGGGATAETPKEWRLSIRIDEEARDRMTAVANYAALEGIIPDNPKGNLTAWVNYCLQVGEEMLKQHAYQARGHK